MRLDILQYKNKNTIGGARVKIMGSHNPIGPRHTKPTPKNWWWWKLTVVSPHVACVSAKNLHSAPQWLHLRANWLLDSAPERGKTLHTTRHQTTKDSGYITRQPMSEPLELIFFFYYMYLLFCKTKTLVIRWLFVLHTLWYTSWSPYSVWFHIVVVIMSPVHAEGSGFNPQRSYYFMIRKWIKHIFFGSSEFFK